MFSFQLFLRFELLIPGVSRFFAEFKGALNFSPEQTSRLAVRRLNKVTSAHRQSNHHFFINNFFQRLQVKFRIQ